MNKFCINTERLSLREINEADADLIVELRSDEDVYKYFKYPHKITKDEHLNWFSNNYLYDDDNINWIGITSDGEAVGIFGARRDDVSGEVEVSYILGPQYQGYGYASEAVNEIIEFCKKYWKCKHVVAIIHKDNIASIKFISSLGFNFLEAEEIFVKYQREL